MAKLTITPARQAQVDFSDPFYSKAAEVPVMGLDLNRWFGNVENAAAAIVGRETVQYVSNLYKYYVAYEMVAKHIQKDEKQAKTESSK